MGAPLHVRGMQHPPQWPEGAACLWQVRDDLDRYVATYRTEAEARAHAQRVDGLPCDWRAEPVYLVHPHT